MSRCLEVLYNAYGKLAAANPDILSEVNNPERALPRQGTGIFYSAASKIYTFKDGKANPVEALGIKKGEIVKVGSLAEVKEEMPAGTSETDIGDQCILPGFVEPHLHIVLSATANGFFEDCDPSRVPGQNFEGVVQKLKDAAGKLKRKQWLLGYGYDPSRLDTVSVEDRTQFKDFTVKLFDQNGLNDRPVLVLNASGHLAYANQLALDAAGISPGDKVEGGEYIVENGKLTGVLVEPPAFNELLTLGFKANLLRVHLINEAIVANANAWSRKGFTTIFDGGLDNATGVVTLLDRLWLTAKFHLGGAAANLLPDDATGILTDKPMPDGGKKFGPMHIKTVKFWMDGSTQGFTAALKEDYEPDVFPTYLTSKQGWARWAIPDSSTITPRPTLPIYDEMEKWALRGYQLMVHSNGDLSTDVVLDAFEELFRNHPETRGIMHRMEHVTVTNEEQIQRAAKLGIAVSHTIGHVHYWGDTFRRHIIGEERANRIDPSRDDVQNNLCYSFNSDSPVSAVDGLLSIKTAATRLMMGQDAALGDTQQISVEAAIAGMTLNPAKQILMSDQVGSLEAGKSADFVILSQDILGVEADQIDELKVKETWSKGRQYVNPT